MAEINRATFYKYYADPFDLLKQIEAELLLDIKQLGEQTGQSEVGEVVKTVLMEMQKNSEYYKVLFSDYGDSQFATKVLMICYQSKLPLLENHFKELTSVKKKWLYYFMAEGVAGILEQWGADGMIEPPEEVAGFIEQLNNAVLKEF